MPRLLGFSKLLRERLAKGNLTFYDVRPFLLLFPSLLIVTFPNEYCLVALG